MAVLLRPSRKFIVEFMGILTASGLPRRALAVSDAGGLKQPYIPAPAPRIVPPSVIVGPMANPVMPKILPRPSRPTSLPKGPPPRASPASSSEVTKPRPDTPQVDPNPVKPAAPQDISTTQEKSEKTQFKSD